MLIAELLNKKVDYEVTKEKSDLFQTQADIGGRIIKFYADRVDVEKNGEVWEVEFSEHKDENDRTGTYKASGSGNELEVFSMVKDSMLELVARYHPYKIKFTAAKDNDKANRASTYERLIKRFKLPGFSYERSEEKSGMGYNSRAYDQFTLIKT